MAASGGIDLLRNLERREIFTENLKPINLLETNRVRPLYQRDVKGHTGCVNALEFSNDEKYLLSGGDDGGVALWLSGDLISRKEPKPRRVMKSQHYSNIFSLGFSLSGNLGYSAGNDCQFIQHDIETGVETFRHEADASIHRLDVHPQSDGVVVFGTEEGKMTIVDTVGKEDSIYNMKSSVFSAIYNPVKPELLCVALFRGLYIFDVRNLKSPCMKLKSEKNRCTFARWTNDGLGVVSLMNADGVSYFYDFDAEPILLADPSFLNSCTMKSCTFVDDIVLCGSDQWSIFAWKLPTDTEVEKVDNAFTILEGHRSIVNHIRHSRQNNVIVSSGVEKIIKCWSPFGELPESYHNPERRAMGDPISALHPIHSIGMDSVEEDLYTLYQFDKYLQKAQERKEKLKNGGESSDDESTEAFIHDILNVEIIQWDGINSPDSDESYAHTIDESESDMDMEENTSNDEEGCS